MKKNILAISYGLLVMALGIMIFCMAMIFRNRDDSDIVISQEQEQKQEQLQEVQVSAFDSMLQGTGEMISQKLQINHVPCLIYYVDTFDSRPIMILQHGLTSRKEDMEDLANAFVQQGYLVVAPDAASHGELENEDNCSLTDLIQKTSQNFDAILDYFSGSSCVDMERIGIAGISLGGLSTLHYVKNGSYNPKVVVTMCATPKYEDLAGTDASYNYMKRGKLVAETRTDEKVKLDEALRQESPYEAVLADTDTCFYLLCGDEDDVVPYQGNVECYEAKKNTAADMVLRVKQGQGHTVTEDDLWEILSYVIAHL